VRVPPPITLAGGQPDTMRPPLHRILGPRAFFGLLLCGFLTACGIPLTPEGLQTPWATPTVEEDCYWTWGDEPLPELSAQVQAAMEAAGLLGVQARAKAHGEYCTGYVSGESSFHQAETDFEVEVQVDSLEDRAALGHLLERILAVIDGFTTEPPPPSPGYIGIGLRTREGQYPDYWLHFEVKEGKAAREEGLRGEALFEALGGR